MKDFLTSLRRFVCCRVAMVVSTFALAGCGTIATPGQLAPPEAGPDPGYMKFVASYMKDNFKELSPYDPAEISTPRWLDSEKGWAWSTCVHFMDHGHRRTYVLFFNDTSVLGARYAVLTDGCGKQTYTAFDLGIGGVRPSTFGDNGPIY